MDVGQVGIVAVNLLGEYLDKSSPGALDTLSERERARRGPVLPDTRGISEGNTARGPCVRAGLENVSFDPDTARRIRDISAAKDRAVRSEVSVHE